MTAVAGTAAVVAVGSDSGTALADGPDKDLFVDITKVKPNVKKPQAEDDATTGTFTVDCGRNENEHFNPDNFIAQPGVRNGAEHLHDYVGNLSTNADSNNKSLQAAGTTCKNGDKSAYFWPVVRINEAEEEEAEENENQEQEEQEQGGNNQEEKQREQQQNKDKAAKAAARVDCPDVASELPEDVPNNAQDAMERELAAIDKAVDDADKKLANADNKADQEAVLEELEQKRKASLDRMEKAMGGQEQLDELAACEVKDAQNAGVDNGDENSDNAQAEGLEDKANEQNEGEQGADNELEGNEGEIQRPEIVDLTFRGSPVGKVTAMPKFLRVLYGDAKVGTNGEKNARDSWTCTGFEDKVLMDKYPICPQGSKVKRIHDFPSCWDGKNTDSKNHRDHIVFPGADGKCKKGFKAVPQLRISLTYNIPREVQQAGLYAVDSFPEEEHNPLSDHDDFANVMSQSIMNRLVNCINTGKKCKE